MYKTERPRDRETERQRDRETERQRDRETERQRDKDTEEVICYCLHYEFWIHQALITS
jgi:hypothetical protein